MPLNGDAVALPAPAKQLVAPHEDVAAIPLADSSQSETQSMTIFGENFGQTQIAIDEAMAELGWLDGATAADNAGITEHTIS